MIRKIYLLTTCLLCAFFVIAPARGARSLAEPDKIKFAVIGDTGTGESNQFGVAQITIRFIHQGGSTARI